MGAKKLDALLVRIAQGDNGAFEVLYEETRRGVYAFLRTYLHNFADREDAMQTVYLYVKRSISTYRAGSNARAWLLQIAKHVVWKMLKKQSCEVPTDEIEITVTEHEIDSTKELLQKALSDEEERIVTLHVLWKYKHREIGELLNLPTGTVTSKYKRALEKLKKYIKLLF